MFPSRKKKDKWSNFKSNFSKYIVHSYFLSALSFLLTFALFISIYIQYICVLEKHSTLIYSSIDEAVDRAWGILITLLKNRYIMHYRCSCCWFGCMLVLNWISIQQDLLHSEQDFFLKNHSSKLAICCTKWISTLLLWKLD